MMTPHSQPPISLRLVSHILCPYVQRAVIALEEKKIPYERIDIDLAAKPDWFKALSPLGKVPLLQLQQQDEGKRSLFESAPILDYLEETYSQNPLYPQDPFLRAEQRAWIVYGSEILNLIADFYNAPTAEQIEHKHHAIEHKFTWLETHFFNQIETNKNNNDNSAPYFLGEKFTMVDAVFAPIFRYFDVFETISPFTFLNNAPRCQAWRTALSKRSSVRHAVHANYAQYLIAFIHKRASYLAELTARNSTIKA